MKLQERLTHAYIHAYLKVMIDILQEEYLGVITNK